MTDTAKCEPPEGWREKDWRWWASCHGGEPEMIRWLLANDGETWLWSVPGRGAAGPAWMAAKGWRLIERVLTPTEVAALRAERDAAVAEVARLRPLLEECANDLAMEIEAKYVGADKYPSEAKRRDRDMEIVNLARAALNPEPAR